MSDNNPYSSPQVESEQVESELVIAERSWAVHWVAVSSLTLAGLLFVMTCMVFWAYLSTLERIKNPIPRKQIYYEGLLRYQATCITVLTVSTTTLAVAGLSVWRRKRWGRIFSLVIAYLMCLFGILLSFLLFAEFPTNPQEIFQLLLFSLIMFVYGIYVSNTLQYKKYKAEFS